MNGAWRCLICALGLLLAAPAIGADAAKGKALFAERCSICHSAEPNDKGGAQGPALIGVFGRRAAATRFSYTRALRGSNLTWNAATLDKYLAAPSELVPGTAMAVFIADAAERADLIAYFQSVASLKPLESTRSVPAASAQSANWRDDRPGLLHRIEATALPPPFATPSSDNETTLAAKPASAHLSVPAGFEVRPFIAGLSGPRRMRLTPKGDVVVAETFTGKITVLHPRADYSAVARQDTFASGLRQPSGLEFYPTSGSPKWLYVGEVHRVVRFAFPDGGAHAEIVVPELPHASGHSSRDLAFSADGKELYVAVGSQSNVAERMPKKSQAEAAAWDARYGLGAAWGEETDRAVVLSFDAEHPREPKIYASGIRNCVGLTIQPLNGALWCTTNERDAIGDDLVPDYSTRVRRGAFYGWPWYYLGSHEDPRLKGDRPDLAGKVSVPDVLYQAHSAALTMTFYAPNSGKSAFPAEYAGDAFVALHGSWNRSLRTGYKLVRVRMRNGEPTGDYQDFLTGFVIDDDSVWGRPVAMLQLPDGSLLMSEDGNNTIYRISYSH